MTPSCPPNRPRRSLRGAWTLAALAIPALAAPASAQTARSTCEACHGELELLRQHVPTLEDAQALVAESTTVNASAHTGMTCTECHEGVPRYPHGDDVSAPTCASCHEDEEAAWSEGTHADDDNATCTSCHGIHDVRTSESLRTAEGARHMQEACASCHFDPVMPADNPHADSVSCAGCHEPHRTLPATDDESSVHVLRQIETCGECHEEVVALWTEDAHASVVPDLAMPGGRVPSGASRAEPPSCTGCHGAHGMLTPQTPAFGQRMAEQCSHCHEDYADSFADSYHGQATTLGSDEVATCYDCHGAHNIFPEDDARSLVSNELLLETCRTCHAQATAGFTLFQPHADHHDKEEYPYVYWSYHLMTALLIGVFTVFGAHTLLWLLRLGLDAIKGPRPPAPSTGDGR